MMTDEVSSAWLSRLQGCEAVGRHFEEDAKLGPFFLAAIRFDGVMLELEVVCLQCPSTYAAKWPSDASGGTMFTVSGSTNQLHISSPSMPARTNITVADCNTTGVVPSPAGISERDFTGKELKLYQMGKTVVEATCSTLRLTGLRPIGNTEAEYYKSSCSDA